MIELDAVTVRYGTTCAVRDVSLRIPDGEWLVIAGANGSGKTSLVQTFNGLIEPNEGGVRVDGKPVEDDLVAARRSVGFVFQNPRDQIVAATVGSDVAFGPENLGLSREEIHRRVDEALEAVGMPDRVDDRIDGLSGGERERVAIAGALAMEPAHLVLDEPFAGLDEPSRRSILRHLRKRHDGETTLIVVTHDLRDLVGVADRVVGLSNGCIAVDARPEHAVATLPSLGIRVPERW